MLVHSKIKSDSPITHIYSLTDSQYDKADVRELTSTQNCSNKLNLMNNET